MGKAEALGFHLGFSHPKAEGWKGGAGGRGKGVGGGKSRSSRRQTRM